MYIYKPVQLLCPSCVRLGYVAEFHIQSCTIYTRWFNSQEGVYKYVASRRLRFNSTRMYIYKPVQLLCPSWDMCGVSYTILYNLYEMVQLARASVYPILQKCGDALRLKSETDVYTIQTCTIFIFYLFTSTRFQPVPCSVQ